MSSRIVARPAVTAAFLIAALTAIGPPARAQAPAPAAHAVPPQDAAVAQSLFDDARRLMIADRFADACPKLAESQRLDPALGTLLNLAVCNERLGKTASAWGEYRDAESVAKQEGRSERAAYAHEHATALEPRLSRLLIVRASGNVDRGIEVRIDGEKVGEAAFGSAVPIDPGIHRAEARATGKKIWATTVTVDDHAEARTLEIPALEDAPEPATVVQGMPGGGPLAITLPSAPPPEEPKAKPGASSKRTVAYVVGGAGVAVLAFGAVAGAQAIVKWNDRQRLCNGDSCSAAGVSADGSARQWAVASDVGLGVGAVALGTAAYLFFTSRAKEPPPASFSRAVRLVPMASATGGGFGLDGAW